MVGRLEVRSDISALMAASLTGELGLNFGEAHVIRPARGVNHNRMSAFVVAAVDQEPSRTDDRISPRVIFCWRMRY